MTEAPTASGPGRRFHLIELVGRGAYGDVYLADQDSGAGFRRKVALKLLNDDVATLKDAGRRMRDEARILGRLAHRNIVTVLDLVRLDERWAIVMDFVPGADLEHLVLALERRSEPFPPVAAIEAAVSVFDALDAASNADDGAGGRLAVIHRDIKPSNVRVTSDGEVKVLDFGVARFSLDTRESQTRSTGWIGTERYMSPERILCEGDSAAGDVYAAAATLVELLVGRPLGRTPVLLERHGPFVEEVLALIRTRLDAEPATIDAVLAALRAGLHADPKARPSARAMSNDLEALTRNLRGETLKQFARRFVPMVDEILGHAPTPASGVLAERSGSSAVASEGAVDTSTFLVAEEASVLGPAPTARSRGAVPLALLAFAAVGLGVVAILLTLAVVVFGVVSGRATEAVPPTEVSVSTPEAPVVVVEPPPEPPPVEPEPEPAAPEPALVAPAAPEPSPAPKPSTPPPEPRPPVAMTRIGKAMVTVKDASSLEVSCGDTNAIGSASARIVNFPAGSCRVQATVLGAPYSTNVTIESERTVRCEIMEKVLRCP